MNLINQWTRWSSKTDPGKMDDQWEDTAGHYEYGVQISSSEIFD